MEMTTGTCLYDANTIVLTDGFSCDLDPTETLSFAIHSSLHSIELQIQNLKRLSRTLQEATPDAKSEVMAIAGLVAETVKYFGSQEALSR